MKKLKIILLFNIVIISIVYILYIILGDKYKSNYKNENYIIGKILSYKINGDQLQIEIKTKEKLLIFYTLQTEEEKIYYQTTLQMGDIYVFSGTLKEPSNNTNFNLFSYRKYLLSKKIYYILEADTISLHKRNNSLLYKLKNYIYSLIEKRNTSDYLYTFLVGNTNELDSDIIQQYRNCGISHLIAISGMHITLFSMILLHLLKRIKSKYFKYGVIIIILWIYAFLVGFTPSIMRAVSSFTILSIAKLLNIKIKPLYILLILGLIFLLNNPFLIYSTSFLFSYIVSLFIILSQNIINRYKNYIIKTFIISLIAFLASIPIIGITFYETNILSPLINIIFVPYISFIIFPFSLLTFITPIIEPIFEFFINILETIIDVTNNYFVLNINIPYINIYTFIIYYVILILIIKSNKLRYSIILGIFILIHSNQKIFQKYPIITMIDVGQGDSILIELPHNKANILIDTGGKITYEKEKWQQRETKTITDNTLLPYLKSIGIKKLDYLILTHGDYDHMGEAINIVENFKVGKIIFNCGEFNELEQDLIKVLDKKKIPYYSCIKELNIDDNKLYFLNDKDYGNENDNSSVIYTELNNHKFLFMGDAGVDVEEDLIEKYNLQNIDVLKVGHHGSKTSSGKIFVDEIKPKYSIISVGKNNRYGHPNYSVLDNLENSQIYRTDQDGSIMLKIKNNKLKIKTCKP